MTADAPVAIRPPQRAILKPARPQLRGLTRTELQELWATRFGGPRFRADQVFEWVHGQRVGDPEAMTNLPAADRARLRGEVELRGLEVATVLRARDGTRKLLLRTQDGLAIESVLIPNEGRGFTQCISSMVGCSLTCRFCATASLGFVRSLAAFEIVDQVYRAQDLLRADFVAGTSPWEERVTNLVFMGMGEPLANFVPVRTAIEILSDAGGAGLSGRRMTVSTAGFVPGIERFGREGLGDEVGLAVSLNATTDEVRSSIMPINTRWPIASVLAAVAAVPTPRRRLVTFEYVLLAGVNDGDADAARLPRLLQGLPAQVNVIPFNAHGHAPYRRPAPERVEAFVARVRAAGLAVFVRTPRGDDIAAACGQLAAEDS